MARRLLSGAMWQSKQAAAASILYLSRSNKCRVPFSRATNYIVQVKARSLHEQYGLQQNQNRRPPEQSRGRLIGRLDRILKSTKAQENLSIEQLAHVQYLRDFWAERGYDKSSSKRDLQHMDVMTHETKEILGRYSASVHDQGSSTIPLTRAKIPKAQDSSHRQFLRNVEGIFGENGRLLAKQALPFRQQIAAWVFAALFAVPLLWVFEKVFTRFFPERARILEESEMRKHKEAQERLYGKNQQR